MDSAFGEKSRNSITSVASRPLQQKSKANRRVLWCIWLLWEHRVPAFWAPDMFTGSRIMGREMFLLHISSSYFKQQSRKTSRVSEPELSGTRRKRKRKRKVRIRMLPTQPNMVVLRHGSQSASHSPTRDGENTISKKERESGKREAVLLRAGSVSRPEFSILVKVSEVFETLTDFTL